MGYTANGNWDAPNEERIRYLFNFPEEAALTISETGPTPGVRSQWCTDTQASQIIRNAEAQPSAVKISLHIMLARSSQRTLNPLDISSVPQ